MYSECDARYQAALARVDACIADLAAKCARGRQLVHDGARAKCPECGARFLARNGHQFLCPDPGCLRARKTRLQRLYRTREGRGAPLTFAPRVAPRAAAFTDLGGRCGCGGELEFRAVMGGAVLERCTAGCPRGHWKPVMRRRAA